MAYQGPPGVFRGIRKRALEIGTDPDGFTDGADYDPQAGHPALPNIAPPGKYQDLPPQVTDNVQALGIPTPFVVGKK